MIDKVITKLQVLQPELLQVIDESYLHRGHQGFREGEVTHIQIKIKAKGLNSLKPIEQHRKIYSLLKEEMQQSLHAVAICLL